MQTTLVFAESRELVTTWLEGELSSPIKLFVEKVFCIGPFDYRFLNLGNGKTSFQHHSGMFLRIRLLLVELVDLHIDFGTGFGLFGFVTEYSSDLSFIFRSDTAV